jgi:hypothetical protein
LKADLCALDAYFSGLPEEEKAQGLFRIASAPPNDDTFLTTRTWKRFGLKAERRAKPLDHNENKEVNDRVVAEMKKIVAAAKTQQGGTFNRRELMDPDSISIQRLIPLQRGKWRIMPPGIEAESEVDKGSK